MKYVKSLVFAAAAAAAAVSASAQVSPTQLVVGFKVASGTGATTNVESNLGTYDSIIAGSYTTAASGAHVYSLGNFNDILTSTYGSSWATTNLVYGVVGTITDPVSTNVTNWITSKWTSTTNQAGIAANSVTPGTNVSDSTLGVTNSKIATMGSSTLFTGAVGQTITIATSDLTSWSKNDPFNLTTTKTDALVKNTYTDLWTAASNGLTGSYSYLGTFAISSGGDLTFSVIPEPSTYAVILGALTIGFVALRRRFSKAA